MGSIGVGVNHGEKIKTLTPRILPSDWCLSLGQSCKGITRFLCYYDHLKTQNAKLLK